MPSLTQLENPQCQCSQPAITTYAQGICAAAKLIDAHCVVLDHPSPAFGPQAPSVTIPKSASPSVQEARQTLLAAAIKIQQLVLEPSEYLPNLAIHYQNFECLHWLCHFRIPSLVPLQGSISYCELARAAAVPEAQLKSIARMTMLSNFLCEPTPGELAHTAPSALFVKNPSLNDWALFMAKGSAPNATKMVEATEKWGATREKNETAFNLAHGTDLSFFQWLSQDPERAKDFSAYMKNVTASSGVRIDHLLNEYDWAGLGEATIIDVGGSTGHASIALATAFPDLSFIVQDLPAVIANTPGVLSSLPPPIASRIAFREHDFLISQQQAADLPDSGKAVYLLRMILHDWPPAEAIKILQNIIPALKQNAQATRLVIMDTVLPTPGSALVDEEALLRVRDLAMMQAFNSHERELSEWEELLEKASAGLDGRLVLKSVNKPLGSVMSLMEVASVDDIAGGQDGHQMNGDGQNGHV